MSYLTLKHFGLPATTFKVSLKTSDTENIAIHLEGAIANHNIANIVGTRGKGKTSAVFGLLTDLKIDKKPVLIAQPLSPDKERMRIGSIEQALVRDLSKESPKRSAEARISQIRRILGDVSGTHEVVLVIEESHLIHHATLRSIKSLMELRWAGRGPLLTVILLGQRNPLSLPSLEEIAKPPRSNLLIMHGLSEAEATAYIHSTVGRVWEETAIAALAADQVARNYLDLQEALIASMDQALAEGRKQVKLSDVFHATGAGMKAMAEQVGLSQAEIGKAIGKDKSQVNRIMSGERSDPDAKARIQALLDQKAAEAGIKDQQAPQQKRAVGGA